jgi:phenylalanyl-tRNA synthetase beta chain
VKLPLSWLREWVELPADWDARELARRLTNSGFEIEAITSAASAFSGVVVARIVSAERHPQADKLQVCQVITGEGASGGAGGGGAEAAVQIVCGAPNARSGLVSALARVGALLPGDLRIGAARLRGVESQGMLCSARELGLAESSDGIIELPDDAPLGADLRAYLDLDDTILEINVTPNRGDAMSVLGIAREVAALTGTALKTPAMLAAALGERVGPFGSADALPVTLQPGAGAARLLARVLRGLDNTRPSPWWLRERLRRAGLRPISAIVDVTNYVMLELGQPMHAYDLARLRGGLSARHARAGERLRLLDGRELELDAGALVIADDESAIGLAGVMGGERSAITPARPTLCSRPPGSSRPRSRAGRAATDCRPMPASASSAASTGAARSAQSRWRRGCCSGSPAARPGRSRPPNSMTSCRASGRCSCAPGSCSACSESASRRPTSSSACAPSGWGCARTRRAGACNRRPGASISRSRPI